MKSGRCYYSSQPVFYRMAVFDSAALPGAAMKFGKNAVGTIQAMLAGDQEPCIPMAAMCNEGSCANIDPETYFPTFEEAMRCTDTSV